LRFSDELLSLRAKLATSALLSAVDEDEEGKNAQTVRLLSEILPSQLHEPPAEVESTLLERLDFVGGRVH
jgi:hypothetical protein